MTADEIKAQIAALQAKLAALDEPFQREERYIVIERKHLNATKELALREHMRRMGIGTVECAVIESDWPEYETVWQMIEARCALHNRHKLGSGKRGRARRKLANFLIRHQPALPFSTALTHRRR